MREHIASLRTRASWRWREGLSGGAALQRVLASGWLTRAAKAAPTIAFYGAGCLLWAVGTLIMLRGQMSTSADGTWVFTFAHDLLAGNSTSGWKPSALPLYFPELTSIITWQWLGFDVVATNLIHGSLSWLLIAAGVWWAARSCGASGAVAAKSAFVVLLINLLSHADDRLVATFEFPFSHGGSTLGTFLGVACVAHGVNKGFNRGLAAAAAVVLALLVASDRAILVQFSAPAIATILAFILLGRSLRSRWLAALGIVVGGTLLGLAITSGIRLWTGLAPDDLPGQYSFGEAASSLRRFLDDMIKMATESPLVMVTFLVSLAILVQRAAAGIVGHWHRRQTLAGRELAALWMAVASVMVLLATVSAVVVTGSWFGIAVHRYVLPLLILPPAFAAILVAPALTAAFAGGPTVIEVALVLGVAVHGIEKKPSDSALVAPAYLPQYACLDRYRAEQDLHSGVSQYWQARPATLFSKRRVTVNQVDARWRPGRWLNNTLWYAKGYWPEEPRPLVYDFAITNGLEEDWILSRFGEPRAREKCFQLNIWVYDRPSDVEFRNYLRTYAARATGEHDSWWEAPLLQGANREGVPVVTFEGSAGTTVEFPRVPANVMDIESKTRRPLELVYLRDQSEVARQRIEFGIDRRRLFALPKQLGDGGFDRVMLKGSKGVQYEISDMTLMGDPRAEAARPETR